MRTIDQPTPLLLGGLMFSNSIIPAKPPFHVSTNLKLPVSTSGDSHPVPVNNVDF